MESVTERTEEEAAGSDRVELSAYEIVREIGRGGMATIHLAREVAAPGRDVALKLIHPHLSGDAQLVERFKHEVQAHVGLHHPNVVEMLGWGTDASGRLFMAMEFVDGTTLKDVMQARRHVPVDIAVQVALGMLRGLSAAHARGLVHRDVKPANVMVTRAGVVKVADFGISKTADMTQLTSTGNVVGTPAYMSPEQALARTLDGRSDLFSVGVVLYEMMLGENPFQTGNPATTLSRVVHHHQRKVFESLPQTPALLEEVLEDLLHKDCEARPGDCAAVLAKLEACVAEEGLATGPEIMAAYLADPEAIAQALNKDRGARHFQRGLKLHAAGPLHAEGAIWDFFLATQLDPASREARTWLEQVTRDRGYNLQSKTSARMTELEGRLQGEPDSMVVLLQLAKLHKAQGNFLQVIYYYKRAKALRPPDRYTQSQIETLVSAQAAPFIDGMGVTGTFEKLQPVASARTTAPTVVVPAHPRAEGWRDFLGGVASTGWARAGAAAAALALAVLGIGLVIDRASFASQPTATRPDPLTEDLDVDRESEALARARQHVKAERWAKAEDVLSRLLDAGDAGPSASEALFMLGDCYERLGRRDDALAAHSRNGEAGDDEWAARSDGRRGELLALAGDLAGATAAYEDMARSADGLLRDEARVEMARLLAREGRRLEAVAAFDAVMPDLSGQLHDTARLDLAETLLEVGEHDRAAALFDDVRETTDHKSVAYRRACDGRRKAANFAATTAPTRTAAATPPPTDFRRAEAAPAEADPVMAAEWSTEEEAAAPVVAAPPPPAPAKESRPTIRKSSHGDEPEPDDAGERDDWSDEAPVEPVDEERLEEE